MKFSHLLLPALLLIFSSNFTSAQTLLKGNIIDAGNGDPLIGANIIVKGTTDGNITDYDGYFEVKTASDFPLTLVASYLGYIEKEVEITSSNSITIALEENSVTVDVVEVKASRISEENKKSPLTIEALDNIAIKETPAADFYSGLGALKGVDLTAASLGFKVINTRGFNSTSPVRSLQIIDGVDNQAPGLNFSLGNFLGSSELDVNKVEIVVGASSAYYGPNAFNGVISMETKNPFFHQGLAASVKAGERNLLKTAVRWADAFNNKNGDPVVAYKLNLEYLRADDWVADNYEPVTDTEGNQVFDAANNPGRADAVNIYGDEPFPSNRFSSLADQRAGLNSFSRIGYREVDLVDYDTRNLKANAAVHIRLKPSMTYESPELIFSSNYGTGTTVYQGDNRFSLKGIRFMQNRIEFRKKNKYFIRAYATNENAGDSYDPYFTALLMQEASKPNTNWSNSYQQWWVRNDLGAVFKQMKEMGYPTESAEEQIQWQRDNADLLTGWHNEAAEYANNFEDQNNKPFYEPGTARFDSLFNAITSRPNNHPDGGTRFIDRSALYHIHGEYNLETSFFKELKFGSNARLYKPESEGTIFSDSITSISNFEYGFYAGATKSVGDFLFSATLRSDKNENFDRLWSPAASIVWAPDQVNYLRVSFSSAIRNPTLSDQYLNLKVGPAQLLGNLTGFDSLITLESFAEYRNDQNQPLVYEDVAPIQPENVKTFEIGYRTTLWEKLYVDLSGYFNSYNNFIGYKIGLELPFDQVEIFPGTFIPFPRFNDIQAYRVAANSTQNVKSQGFAGALNYYIGQYLLVNGNYSWNKLATEETDDIIPAFNTPEHKYNLGISGRKIPIGSSNSYEFGFNINYKWIQGFVFEGSPQFTGNIPSYSMMDAQVNLAHPKSNLTFKLGASNILNNKQFQTYGGPRIGRLGYVSLTYDFKKKI